MDLGPHENVKCSMKYQTNNFFDEQNIKNCETRVKFCSKYEFPKRKENKKFEKIKTHFKIGCKNYIFFHFCFVFIKKKKT